MKVFVKKMSSLKLLKLELIIGCIIMAVAIIGLPVGILVTDAELLLDPNILGVILVAMLMFGLVAYFLFIRPYILYRKTPMVQVETDGEFLYIYGKKQAKIPLASIDEISIRVELPFILQKEFLREMIIHMFSEKYGDIVLEIANYGTFRLRFVSNAQDSADELFSFLEKIINSADAE